MGLGKIPAASKAAPIELPSWLNALAPPQPVVDIHLRPSEPGEDQGRRFRAGESAQARADALRRGTLVHRLLQSLPDIASERRREAALKYLARNAADWNEATRRALAERLLALIGDARFAPVFATGSRAEISIVGRLERPGRLPVLVSGQIDRLVVTADEVFIVDFKTNHAPPIRLDEVPRVYVRQLALYRAVLAKLYPQRGIRAALLWTESTELMEISAPALDAELASFGAGAAELDPATPRS